MIKWSEQQLAVFNWVEHDRGSAVVEAVAGAGKTTTLVEAVRRMRGTVFLGAFNKKMSEELKTRVADMRNVVAGTFHSAGFSALRKMLGRVEVSDRKVRDISAELVHNTDQEGWEPAICALVSMAKQRGFYVRELIERPNRNDWLELAHRYDVFDRLPEDASPTTLVDLAHQALISSNKERTIIDFDDMVYLPLLLQCRLFQNDWVLIDEAQDTNATRRALARRMLKPTGRLVAVGDPCQAIFGFTGADSDSLELIRREFQAKTLSLSVTYRCPKAVVRAAREYVQHITPAATAPEGEHLDMDYAEMLKLVQPGSAILCRTNKQLVEVCFKLIRAGTPARIEGRAIGDGLAALAGRWKVKNTDALRERLDAYEAREVEKALAREDESKAERIQDQCGTLRVLIERAAEQAIHTVGGLQQMIKSMFEDVGSNPRLVTCSSVHRSKGLEWGTVYLLGRRQLMPSKQAKQAWQAQAEINLIYVALTRAQATLVDVDLPNTEPNKTVSKEPNVRDAGKTRTRKTAEKEAA